MKRLVDWISGRRRICNESKQLQRNIQLKHPLQGDNMKYLLQSVPISSMIVAMFNRWHGPFRSHAGFTFLGVLVIVILAVLVFEVVRGRDERSNAGTGNEGQSK
jgi:hypothetical protein